jgi:hypothetical protein
MNRCQPSHSQSPNRMKRPSATVMKDRKEVRKRGPLGPVDQPDALPNEERRHDPEPPHHRDRPHPVTSEECLVLSIRRGQDEGTQPHGVCDG